MNKAIILLSIIIVIGAMFTAVIIFKPNTSSNVGENVLTQIAEEEILDECTDEYEELRSENTVKTNMQEEKTSPNCSLTIKTYFSNCGHIKSEYMNLPQDLINLTKEEIQERYEDYQIENFASNEVVLYQEKEGECGEHYIVKDCDGQLTVYQILEDGTQKELEVTGVTTEYLPQTDQINIKKGIRVNGKQQLNQLIEDFE